MATTALTPNPTPVPSPDTDKTGLGYGPPEQPSSILNCVLTSNYANSYIDQAFADNYFANHYNATYTQQWAALNAGQKAQLLIEACSDLEQCNFVQSHSVPHYNFFVDPTRHALLLYVPRHEATKYNFYQSLQFPRNSDQHSDGSIYVPDSIQRAQCEQAIYKLTFDQSILANALQGMQSNKVTVGNLSVSQQFTGGGINLSPTAHAWIKPFLRYGKRVTRG